MAHARIAVASSGLIGCGPGNSVQRDFLSHAYSDFIYAIIIEELGLVGGIVVVVLYFWLLVRVGRIASRCTRTFPAFLILGIALLLVTQAMFNMMVAVGMAPCHGAAAASHQQGWHLDVHQLRLHWHDIEREPVHCCPA